jgi:hypothetical protein
MIDDMIYGMTPSEKTEKLPNEFDVTKLIKFAEEFFTFAKKFIKKFKSIPAEGI